MQLKMIFRKLLNQNKLFDSHCHLNTIEYDNDRPEVVARAREANVDSIIDIGVDLPTTLKAIRTAQQNPGIVYASAGIDPEVFIIGSDLYNPNADKIFKELEKISKLFELKHEYIAMVGETGIDNYWNQKSDIEAKQIAISLEYQRELFKEHIKLAETYNLPLSIHSREAIDDCINILNHYKSRNVWGVFHSVTPHAIDNESSFEAKVRQILEMDFFISLNGIFTYKSATLLRKVVLKVLREKLGKARSPQVSPIDLYKAGFVFETDGPFLAPEGRRGARNEPAFITLIFDLLKQYI